MLRACLLIGLSLMGCTKSQPEERPPAEPKLTETAKTKPGASSAPQAPKLPDVPGAQQLPVKFPAVTLDAQAGQQVFAPPESWLARAMRSGVDQQVIALYAGELLGSGAENAKVKSKSGAVWTVPNALVVPVATAAKAGPGDIVLTHWPQGDSWMRAVVVPGGSAESPVVRFLDVALDEPAGWGKREHTLTPGSFSRLDKPGLPGTSASCQVTPSQAGSSVAAQAEGAKPTEPSPTRRLLVIRVTQDQVLGLGYAGKLQSLPRGNCVLLPPTQKPKAGELAQAPVTGVYVSVRVLGVGDEALGGAVQAPGRVYVTRAGAGAEKPWAVALPDLIAPK